ncbi:MAG TPA: MBL fold metallo-hydrolase [Pyrinomonadaceae bacterium]|nr:MBL fold metallo-hydrolase [Pyrinomonadaceae bacterium]
MTDQKYYLKPNVQLEPLFNQWYAWAHLISPATAAMNIANSHLNIMQSFVRSPDIHAAAVKNPAMRGGPFLDVHPSRVNEIKQLIETTLSTQGHMVEFAKAIKQLSELLASEATGYSLEPLYEKVPEVLKGFIELVYDAANQPSFRLIEGLLYKSEYYNPAAQTIALSLVSQDDRPFVFSTPRLEDDQHLHLEIPFHDERIDKLFRMRTTPETFGALKEFMGITNGNDDLLRSFLTEAEPPKPQRYDGDKVRIRYYGHACVLIESKDASVLTDPVISYSYPNDFERYTYLDLPESIDYVLITHSHSDHIMFESLLQLRHRIKNIVVPRNNGGALEDPSLKLALKNIGFENVIDIDDMETLKVKGGDIMGLPFLGEHADLNIRSKTAYLVRLAGTSVICAADSSNLEPKLYQHIRKEIGEVDVVFIGMECDGAPLSWVYGPLLIKTINRKMDQSRRLSGSDFQRAMGILDHIPCKSAYVYAMGQEPWLGYVTSIKYTDESKPIVESNKLVEMCRSRGLQTERLLGTKELLL